MAIQSLNIAYTSTSSYQPTQAVQQITILDTTNTKFLRQAFLSNQGIKLVHVTASVFIPISQLFAAAYTYSPTQFTWPPVIITQPTGSLTVIHPTTATFSVSASSELPITYSWNYQLSGSNTWNTLPVASGSNTNTITLACPNQTPLNSSSYACYLYNLAGATTSSYGKLYVL
jgi:hypothetical protein